MVLSGEQFGTITEADAVELLRRDLAIAEAAVRRLFNVPLTQNQLDESNSTYSARIRASSGATFCACAKPW